MLNIYKHTRKNGHRAILRDLQEDVEEVLRTGGFLQLYEVEG
jgi:anti-anti-sigma regulatory factor